MKFQPQIDMSIDNLGLRPMQQECQNKTSTSTPQFDNCQPNLAKLWCTFSPNHHGDCQFEKMICPLIPTPTRTHKFPPTLTLINSPIPHFLIPHNTSIIF